MALGHNIMQFFMITKNQVKEKCFYYILYFKHQLKIETRYTGGQMTLGHNIIESQEQEECKGPLGPLDILDILKS